jgi:hypothetical protein
MMHAVGACKALHPDRSVFAFARVRGDRCERGWLWWCSCGTLVEQMLASHSQVCESLRPAGMGTCGYPPPSPADRTVFTNTGKARA